MFPINRTEVQRYLGYRGNTPDEQVLQAIEEVIAELQRVMRPKFVTRPVAITATGEASLSLDTLLIESKSLAQHLKSCNEGILFAATLGAQVDQLIHRYNVLDLSRAVILQAAAAAAIEDYCDLCQNEIEAEAKARGLYLRPRYSPGYGDFPLSFQKELLELLDAQRRIGLTRTGSNMLVPEKSVTAVIGLTSDPTSCHASRCMTCNAKNCPFRKG